MRMPHSPTLVPASQVAGAIFGDFADTEEKKRQLYPMLVVGWDKDARCPDHQGAEP